MPLQLIVLKIVRVSSNSLLSLDARNPQTGLSKRWGRASSASDGSRVRCVDCVRGYVGKRSDLTTDRALGARLFDIISRGAWTARKRGHVLISFVRVKVLREQVIARR